ncbi:cupin domain-containing protein [Pelagibacterium limicola]|uniref:cupin domain-containing protein n=1 Tax=Pelagibacterium limicola TaxID=2791022 RepID=UPI0018B01184|nr:cupin domain-containing protein [Pelagibacterium limicola]
MRGNVAKVSQHFFADDGRFPNNRLPLIVYAQAITGEAVTPEAVEQMFDASGWPPQWRYTVYDFHHYHSSAHEALGCARGEARIRFGGPNGETLAVKAGDVVVIPAGVAHMCESASEDFMMVGAYPPGQDYDLLKGEEGERPQADETIAKVPVPQTDPVAGWDGPLLRAWG